MKSMPLIFCLLLSTIVRANDSYFVNSQGQVELGSNSGWNINERMRNGLGIRTYDYSSIRANGGNENVPMNTMKRVFVEYGNEGHSVVELTSIYSTQNPNARFPWSVWNSENTQQSAQVEEFERNGRIKGRTTCDRYEQRKCITVTVDFCKGLFNGLQSVRRGQGKSPFSSVSEILKEVNYCSQITNPVSQEVINELINRERNSQGQVVRANVDFQLRTDDLNFHYLSEGLSGRESSGEVLRDAFESCSEPRILSVINADSNSSERIESGAPIRDVRAQ